MYFLWKSQRTYHSEGTITKPCGRASDASWAPGEDRSEHQRISFCTSKTAVLKQYPKFRLVWLLSSCEAEIIAGLKVLIFFLVKKSSYCQ